MEKKRRRRSELSSRLLEQDRDVILQPVASEKAAAWKTKASTPSSWIRVPSKTEIKQAVEAIFGVKVASVSTAGATPARLVAPVIALASARIPSAPSSA